MVKTPVRQLRVRSTFAALGAAVAVAVGAGGVVHYVDAGATPGASAASSYVSISPCRLIDTRPETNIGPRATPLVGGAATVWSAWGLNGECSLPADATALTLNVTIVNPTASGYLMMWPTDQPQPTASNLNWVAGQAATPNATTVRLSSAGQVSAFANAGTVDLIVDVAGYFIATPGTSVWINEYAAAQYLFTGDGCAAGSARFVVEREWGPPNAFPDMPCVALPVWQNSGEVNGGVQWSAPLPSRPPWVTLSVGRPAYAIDRPPLPAVPGVFGTPMFGCDITKLPQGDSIGCFLYPITSFPFDASTMLTYSGLLRPSVVVLGGER